MAAVTIGRTCATWALCLAALLICAGAADGAALCGGARYALGGGHGGVPPMLTLRIDGVEGAFLIDYGATRSSLSAEAFGGADGATRRAALPFPGLSTQDFLLRAYDPGSGRIGILGVDVLSRITAQFSAGEAFLGAAYCESGALRALGFVPIAEKGFFAADAAGVDSSRPNVPVVFLRLGAVRAFAQIDTGYGDTIYPHSVDVNEALYDKLVASGIALEKIGRIGVRTCEGKVENRSVYSATGAALAIENEKGASIARTERYFLIVKAPNACGGIGGMKEPAAQLGASFLELFGTTIFDAKAGTVWVKAEDVQTPSP